MVGAESKVKREFLFDIGHGRRPASRCFCCVRKSECQGSAADGRGAIAAEGRYYNGAWHVVLTRSLDAPDPTDSKALEPGGEYTVAFAVHEGKGARWHRISLPLLLHLDDGSEPESCRVMPRISALPAQGALSEAAVEYTDVRLIHPGQITWLWLHGADHPGQTLVSETPVGFHDVAPLHPLERLVEWIIQQDETGELPEDAPGR